MIMIMNIIINHQSSIIKHHHHHHHHHQSSIIRHQPSPSLSSNKCSHGNYQHIFVGGSRLIPKNGFPHGVAMFQFHVNLHEASGVWLQRNVWLKASSSSLLSFLFSASIAALALSWTKELHESYQLCQKKGQGQQSMPYFHKDMGYLMLLEKGGIYTSNFCLLILGLPWAVASAQTIAMAAACCSLSLSFFLSASIAALILSWRKGLHEVNFSIQNIQNKCKPHAGSSSIPNEQYSALISTVLATRTLSIVKASSSLSLVFLLSASSAASILSWTKRLHDQKSHRNPKHQKQSRAYMEIQRPPRVCSCPNN